MKVNEPTIEHVYTPTFFFDQLPNNNVHTHDNSSTSPTGAPCLSKKAQWYRAALAPVSFDDTVFWQVLERWILEAPSIIPPISKVEILSSTVGSSNPPMGAVDPHSTLDLEDRSLLDGMVSFKTMCRQLIPKRADKDPIMKERLYYCRDTWSDQDQDQNQGQISTGHSSKSSVRHHAIFAPVLDQIPSLEAKQNSIQRNPEQEKEQGQGQEQEQGSSKSQDNTVILMKNLPFYYPKVRGFRYGYRYDPEEAPEDQDDDHDVDSHEKETIELEDAFTPGQAQGQQQQSSKSKKHTPKKRIVSRRIGWISLDLYLKGDEGEFTDKIQYAFKELFKKLYKWGNNTTKGFTKSRVQHDVMVPKDLYLKTYARMKEKYAQKWVQSWPERTDPTKFVFEDIAIAAWLVALWELERNSSNSISEIESAVGDHDRAMTTEHETEHPQDQADTKNKKKMQTFVDLGCGNGLLTHILNEEGHKGTGIDIVSRKVWDVYGSNTELIAKTLIPNETVYNGVDWIIGNHADELAPWVPIIASRSSPLTRFVVIPCCFFDLNGSRYQFAEGAPDGKYKAYLGYISNVIATCGYELQTEVLRIPSTKNIALVGMSRRRRRRDHETLSLSEKETQRIKLNDRYSIGEEEEEEQDDGEEEEARARTRRRVDALVDKSGIFVARISDKEKQASLKAKQSIKAD
ncbi:hypothetical protein FBU30_010359 [Linnemannia zychae]|nr:hypothetical protein FBU30_010359 [Linnemannia zychae]